MAFRLVDARRARSARDLPSRVSGCGRHASGEAFPVNVERL
jgi:hypothetical protein